MNADAVSKQVSVYDCLCSWPLNGFDKKHVHFTRRHYGLQDGFGHTIPATRYRLIGGDTTLLKSRELIGYDGINDHNRTSIDINTVTEPESESEPELEPELVHVTSVSVITSRWNRRPRNEGSLNEEVLAIPTNCNPDLGILEDEKRNEARVGSNMMTCRIQTQTWTLWITGKMVVYEWQRLECSWSHG